MTAAGIDAVSGLSRDITDSDASAQAVENLARKNGVPVPGGASTFANQYREMALKGQLGNDPINRRIAGLYAADQSILDANANADRTNRLVQNALASYKGGPAESWLQTWLNGTRRKFRKADQNTGNFDASAGMM
jgi:hypothetical protein